jgi:ribosomal protein L37AE/L43A
MKIKIDKLLVRTKKTTETILFDKVTFIYGPVGKGKSTVARLIDFCLGGDLEKTPAVQQEFIAAILYLSLGNHDCTIERSADDLSRLRLTWSGPNGDLESINAPINNVDGIPILGDDIYNLSDLVYYLCGVTPIKVRKKSQEHDSPLIRLSFRDIWRYCYLNQTHLDSSFFRFEDPFRGRKSQDAMRFFTGLHSESLSQIEAALMEAIDEQRAKREAVLQIRKFMEKFSFGSEIDLNKQLQDTENEINIKNAEHAKLQESRTVQIHPTDTLREHIRLLSQTLFDTQTAIYDSQEVISEQKALRAELITAKIKTERAVQAGQILKDAQIDRCPECGRELSGRKIDVEKCRLCGTSINDPVNEPSIELEIIRQDLNSRIDEIEDSTQRREQALERTKRQLDQLAQSKQRLDRQLQEELYAYDSAIIENIRNIVRDIAKLEERVVFLKKLIKMPQAINDLEEQAGAKQGKIDRLKTDLTDERKRLVNADKNIIALAENFKQIMLHVGFPGVFSEDRVTIDPRNWKPVISHKDIEWSFWDAGSGGKKTLFNVCFALALHLTARERKLPVPTILIIDSPTKNISEDENPVLVQSLYSEMYKLIKENDNLMQLILIDSDIVEPETDYPGFLKRHMAGTPNNPSLISYYDGP